MGKYYAFHKTVMGYLHKKKDIPCEDSSDSFFVQNADERKQFYIAVVADGHGDTACMRSKTGSKKAVEIAIDCLKEFAESVVNAEQGTDSTQESDEYKGYRSIVDMLENAAAYGRNAKDTLKARVPESLTNAIVSRWHQFVNEDIRVNKLTDTEEEMAQASRYADAYREGRRLEHIYGTTLIAALMLPDYLLLIQQGDGRCDVFYEDGTVDQPIPWDERCHENVTTSMCDEDVATRIRSRVIDLREKKVIACFLGSDGVEDSYRDMEGTHMFYRSLIAELVERGTDAFETYLEEMLPQFTQTGSGDDVSVSGIVDIEHAKNFVPIFQLQNKQYNLKDDLDRYESRIISMSRKHGILRENVDEAKKECEKLNSQLRAVCTECNKVNEDYNKYVMVINNLKQQCKESAIRIYQLTKERKKLADLQCESTRNNGGKDILSNVKNMVSQFINPANQANEQKIDAYTMEIKRLKSKINSIEKENQKVCNTVEALKEKRAKLEQQVSFVEQNLSTARNRIQKAQQDFSEYDQEYQSIQAEIERIQQEITLLDEEKKRLDSCKYIYKEKNEMKTHINTGLEQKQEQSSNFELHKEANPQIPECHSAEITYINQDNSDKDVAINTEQPDTIIQNTQDKAENPSDESQNMQESQTENGVQAFGESFENMEQKVTVEEQQRDTKLLSENNESISICYNTENTADNEPQTNIFPQENIDSEILPDITPQENIDKKMRTNILLQENINEELELPDNNFNGVQEESGQRIDNLPVADENIETEQTTVSLAENGKADTQ